MSLTIHAVPTHVLLVELPLPEPLAAPALYWKVMFVIGTSMERSAPSTLGVSSRLELESQTVV